MAQRENKYIWCTCILHLLHALSRWRGSSEPSGRHGNCTIEEREEHSIKLALGQPWVWSVSDIICLASVYEGGGQSSPSLSYLPTVLWPPDNSYTWTWIAIQYHFTLFSTSPVPRCCNGNAHKFNLSRQVWETTWATFYCLIVFFIVAGKKSD